MIEILGMGKMWIIGILNHFGEELLFLLLNKFSYRTTTKIKLRFSGILLETSKYDCFYSGQSYFGKNSTRNSKTKNVFPLEMYVLVVQ